MRTLTRFVLWTALIAGLLLGVLRATAIRWFRLPTDDPTLEASILPTLRGGDLVIAWRITKPKFGDLVICPEPDYPERYVIGRIIGEPGDEVVIKKAVPYVNGKTFVEERACDPPIFYYPNPNNEAEEIKQQCGWEGVANHLHMMGVARGHTVPLTNLQIDVVEGTYFLISDNRLYPYDSRDFGLVSIESCRESIVGRIVSKDGWMDSENRLDYIH